MSDREPDFADQIEPCPGCGDPDCDFDCDGEYVNPQEETPDVND